MCRLFFSRAQCLPLPVGVGADEARIYDPTDGNWIEPAVQAGHGAHVAIRAEIPVALK